MKPNKRFSILFLIFSRCFIEVLALGIIAVSSVVSGAKEVLNDGEFGYVAPDFTDEVAFADLISIAIEQPLYPKN